MIFAPTIAILSQAGGNGLSIGKILLVVIGSFLCVMIYQLVVRRQRRRTVNDTLDLLHRGNTAEAEENLRKAVRRDDSDAISWFHLGLCRELSGDIDDARDIYERISDDPRVDFAARQRLLELKRGRPLDTTRLKALGKLEEGVGLLAVGEVDEAEAAFEEGAALHPAYRPVDYYLGTCAEIKRRPREAIGHYQRLRGEESEPTLLDHRILAVEKEAFWTTDDTPVAIGLRKAWNYLQTDDVERAVEELEELVRRHPDEYTAHFGLALCHIMTDTPEAAREHYEMVPPGDFRYDDAQQKLRELSELLANQQEEPQE